MYDLTKQQQLIEKERSRLHELVIAKRGNLADPEVNELSAHLDRLIVAYERSKMEKNKRRQFQL